MAEPVDGRPFGWKGLVLEFVRSYDGPRALPAEWRSRHAPVCLLRCGRNDRDGYIADVRGVSKCGDTAFEALNGAVESLKRRIEADRKFLEEFE